MIVNAQNCLRHSFDVNEEKYYAIIVTVMGARGNLIWTSLVFLLKFYHLLSSFSVLDNSKVLK